ncbi:coniferyl-aldehyde dehydrogenase [Aminobacter lissarensis]|uniref:Aldehyde dehydrogenase n=1 Tax=Aminobacter carboxidus TaxID=376165 RepID=A0A8E1WDT6_9HYPH|nr:coniferyl aldehyde dehydrogenase [Aminobacter lissarensis]MBB6466577.1 coniferyl-aldehyde dehydrogenase [Aminobacter lissarensis]
MLKPNDSQPDIGTTFETLRAAWLETRPAYAQRVQDLKRLQRAFTVRLDEMVEAISADFGHRSRHESLLGEGSVVLSEIRHTLRKLKSWMKPERRSAGWKLLPASAEIRHVPLGVVGIIAPWNYPVNLALAPLIAAIAAGNHVFLKPSEHTPRTAAFLQSLLAEVFPASRVAVATGGAELSAAFSELHFDHLFFTGSTAVGRKVMAAAARNLTPITLELGGKSPAIVAPSAHLERAARRIATGKFFNAGQTCIAPDYVLVPKDKRDEFVRLLKQEASARYNARQGFDDYTSVINDSQFARLTGLLDDSATRGFEQVPLLDTASLPSGRVRVLAPTVVLDPATDSAVMRDEIFGPILPVIGYGSLDEATAYVLGRDRPLALYCFGEDKAEIEAMLQRIVAGGVCVNDTLYQFACAGLPFGGVGASGMGHYHGREGFLTLSKAMPVLRKYQPSASDLIRPPYKGLTDWLVRLVTKLH